MLRSPNPSPCPTALGVLLRGAVAGAVGTAVMDLVQYLRHRRSGSGGESPLDWEFHGVKDWAGAPAPAQVGKRVIEGLLQTRLPDTAANPVNNVVHWAYGIGWGAAFALAAGPLHAQRTRWAGPLFGTAVWLTGYAVLPATGLYKPIWTYDARTLARDWSGHLVYGTATAAAYTALPRRACRETTAAPGR
ncbi:hypothetical protein ACFQLX_01985 [Streptomyces polyrhachis]|uniref:DUF1440 domain-containing protein n=1 Tax=Streptomyces polyrhachis TaxID=1282885 RepID=A0ABW2GBL9_9ACTN